MQKDDFTDPIAPALAIPMDESDPTTIEARANAAGNANAGGDQNGNPRELDISDSQVPLAKLRVEDLPQCPQCQHGLLRPGVVWFGEVLPQATLTAIEDWIKADMIDLIMVIGTSARVYPAAAYVDRAREKGARVAIINMDSNDVPASGLQEGDWFFEGDASQLLPELLRPIIGNVARGVDT